MKIVLTDAFTTNPGDLSWEALEKLGELQVFDFTPDELLVSRIKDADIVISNKTIINGDHMAQCNGLKLIAVSATGYNNIDIDGANAQGITVCNAPGYSNQSVAQHVIASILNVYNNISFYNQSVHEGRWQKSRDFTYFDEPIEELGAKNFGIIGYGSIGREVAKVARVFGAQIFVMAHPSREITDSNVKVLAKEEFLGTCDIISLHVPLRPETEGMINTDFLNKMKTNAILINTARGPIMVEEDLATALKQGVIRAACVDVLHTEPPESSPLFGVENCIITPHQAWVSKQARERLMDIVANNIQDFIEGKEMVNKIG